MIVYTCPVCGNDLTEICHPTYPPSYGVECFSCGYSEITHTESITRVPFESKDKLAMVLSEHFGITCDLCQSYFKTDSCPSQINRCNGVNHWKLLIERIKNEKD